MITRRSALLAVCTSLALLVSSVVVSVGTAPGVARAAASAATCAPDSGTASISGTVTGPGSTPLANVTVTAYTTYGDYAGAANTNATGAYKLATLIGGSYLLQFKPQTGATAAEWYTDQPSAQTATPVAVVDGGSVTGINEQLDTGAQFSGNVTGAGGGPLQSVQVIVYDATGQYAASAYTDAAGNYTTTPGLPNGSYRIKFEQAYGYLDSYYNNKPSLETADPLVVTAPGVRTGVNATLARGGEIVGKVTNSVSGLPLANISVNAQGKDGSGYSYTDASGIYTITGLLSDSYSVRAYPTFDGINLTSTPITVTVTAPNTVTGANITMAPGGTLTGKVTDSGGAPLKDITVFVGNQDGSYQNYVYTNATGVYSATALPSGQYEVLFRPSNYVPEAYNDHPNFADADRVNVTSPNTVSGVDAVLAAGGSISGKVTDASTGLPIKDVFVEVLGADGDRVETANTQADGTYKTETTLASGTYKVRFNADERFASCTYVTEYYNGKLSEDNADQVTVSAPNTTTNINAALTQGSIIFGKVTDAVTGAPITSGQVNIYDANGKNVMFGRLTFLGGWHSETGLPSGTYRVKFSDYDTGYIDQFYNNASSLATATPLVLNAPTDVTGIDAKLAKGGFISGKVTAADTGAPFTQGEVEVYDASGTEVASTFIEEDGSYNVLDGLATGTYRVGVVPRSSEGEGEGEAAAIRPAQAEGDASTGGYTTTFYGNVVVLSAASPVPLTTPNTTSNIDIKMLRGVWLPVVIR